MASAMHMDLSAEASRRRSAPRAVLLVACALNFAQFLLASHEIEHLDSVDDEACQICLLGGGVGTPMVSSPPGRIFGFVYLQRAQAVRDQVTVDAVVRSHSPRAPPAPISPLKRFV